MTSKPGRLQRFEVLRIGGRGRHSCLLLDAARGVRDLDVADREVGGTGGGPARIEAGREARLIQDDVADRQHDGRAVTLRHQ